MARRLLETVSATGAMLLPLVAGAHPEPQPVPLDHTSISWFQPGEPRDWDIRFVPFGNEPARIYPAQPGTLSGCWKDDLTDLLQATESGAALAYVRARADGLASDWSPAQLVSVPEPSTGAMTIAGVLGLGLLASRRRIAGSCAQPG